MVKSFLKYTSLKEANTPYGIIRNGNRLLNSMDMEIAAVAKDLLIAKHQLTVKNYEQSLTAASTRLVIYVPKTLLTYQLKKVELFQKELTAELARTEDPEIRRRARLRRRLSC